MQYSFKKGLGKMLINVIIIGLPLLVQILPQEWMNVTLGGALYMLLNYVKVKYSSL